MNFSLRQLRAFLSVAAHRSFTKASEEIHVTQAGLSAMIRELEKQVRAPLFERTTRTVDLTEAGRLLLPVAARTVRDLEGVMAALDNASALAQRKLKIGIAPLIASSMLPEVLRRHSSIPSGVAIEAVDADRDQIQSLVESGSIDAGFGIFFDRVSGIRRKALFPCTLAIAMPGNFQTAAPAISWAQLPQAPLICLPQTNPIQILAERCIVNTGLTIRERITVRNLATILGMVEAQLGIAIVPSLCAFASRHYAIRMAILREPETRLDYYCITRAGRKPPEGLANFSQVFARTALEMEASLTAGTHKPSRKKRMTAR